MKVHGKDAVWCGGTATGRGEYSTVQYSTVQYSTVQYSTVQYSTVALRPVPVLRQEVMEGRGEI